MIESEANKDKDPPCLTIFRDGTVIIPAFVKSSAIFISAVNLSSGISS